MKQFCESWCAKWILWNEDMWGFAVPVNRDIVLISPIVHVVQTTVKSLHTHTPPSSSELGRLGSYTLNLFPNGLIPKHVRHTRMLCGAATYLLLKILWVWLQLLAVTIQLLSSLFFSQFNFFILSFYPLCPNFFFPPNFAFHFRVFHWHDSCLLLPEPLVSHCLYNPLCVCVCVLNRNPFNPTSNGVFWERYQTWPLGLVLWPNYIHEKQGFNTCPKAFWNLLWRMCVF